MVLEEDIFVEYFQMVHHSQIIKEKFHRNLVKKKMIHDDQTTNLSFDDILLVPADRTNTIKRVGADISSTVGNPLNKSAWLKLQLPFIIAPMENISSTKMLEYIAQSGGLGFIQRHQPIEDRINQAKLLDQRTGFAVNISEAEDKDFIKRILDLGIKVILIDTAVGHNNLTLNAVSSLRSAIPDDIHIMCGNVSSFEAYKGLMDAGCDSVRVGIGGGAACTTRLVTGFGVPTMGSIMDIYKRVNPEEVNGIIADSGIKNSGDITKSFASGASAVMMGSLFAGHDECDGETKTEFRGLASLEIQLSNGVKDPYSEGVSGNVPYRGSVNNTVKDLVNGLKSGMSYAGVRTIKQLQKNTKYIVVSQQVVNESNTRI
jgi:IMP dehydrogenase/GMP reductase